MGGLCTFNINFIGLLHQDPIIDNGRQREINSICDKCYVIAFLRRIVRNKSLIMEITNNQSQLINQNNHPDALVLYESRGLFLTITLNRPKALNALNDAMLTDLTQHLPLMNQHQAVWLQGAGGKSFCSGGDVKSLFSADSTVQDRVSFFRKQLTLDYEVSRLKPVQISCWDGYVMGGGAGLSAFAPVVIATDKTVFSMPESRIGLFADVGITHVLARMRNNLGYYLGVTGAQLRGEQVYIAGLAHFYIPSDKLKLAYIEISQVLSQKMNNPKAIVQQILKKYHSPSGTVVLTNEHQINQLFSLKSVTEIYQQAKTRNRQFQSRIAKTMQQLCPLSMELTFRLIKDAEKLALKECFIRDFQVIEHLVASHNFKQGVRCVLIEKGSVPKWSCLDLASLKEEEVERHLKPISNSNPLYLE